MADNETRKAYAEREARTKAPQAKADDKLWCALLTALPHLEAMNHTKFVKQYGVAKYEECAAIFNKYVELGAHQNATPEVLQAISGMVMTMLKEHLGNIGYGTRAASLLDHIEIIEEAVDANLPGYHRTRLLGAVATIWKTKR